MRGSGGPPGEEPPEEPPADPVELTSGVAVTGLSRARQQDLYFYIDVPDGAATLTVELEWTAVIRISL